MFLNNYSNKLVQRLGDPDTDCRQLQICFSKSMSRNMKLHNLIFCHAKLLSHTVVWKKYIYKASWASYDDILYQSS